nr:MAG TPA: hypothetical protein [Caudoviricetes sp.]
MKNKLNEHYKNEIERILYAIVDTTGNYELKIIVNDKGYKVLKDNEELDNYLTINTLMALLGIFSLDDLENELLTEQLELFKGVVSQILNIRKECKNEEKA